MKRSNHFKLTRTYAYILILLIISLLISVIGVCILPRIGRLGLLRLLCTAILMIYVSIILGFSAWKSIKAFKKDRTLCVKNIFNYIVYVILFGISIGAIFIMVCGGASAIASFKSKFIEVKLSFKIAYIIVHGIVIFIPYIILRLLYKYWNNKPKIEKETFYRCISCIILTILSVISMVNGVSSLYKSNMDLLKESTKQVVIANVYTERNSSTRSGTTYKLKGVDKNGKSYSFSIDRKDYNSLKSSNGRNLKITYYCNSQVIEKIDL